MVTVRTWLSLALRGAAVAAFAWGAVVGNRPADAESLAFVSDDPEIEMWFYPVSSANGTGSGAIAARASPLTRILMTTTRCSSTAATGSTRRAAAACCWQATRRRPFRRRSPQPLPDRFAPRHRHAHGQRRRHSVRQHG